MRQLARDTLAPRPGRGVVIEVGQIRLEPTLLVDPPAPERAPLEKRAVGLEQAEHQSVETIAETALQEDVDVVGLSILSGAHLPLTEKLFEAMRARGVEDKPVVVGGNIPERDHARLKELGVSAVFPTGSRFDDIVATLNELE